MASALLTALISFSRLELLLIQLPTVLMSLAHSFQFHKHLGKLSPFGIKTILLIIHRIHKGWLALKFRDKLIFVKCQFDLSRSLRQTWFLEHPA